jgi:hypothetical protein
MNSNKQRSRRVSNAVIRSTGLSVKRGRVDADDYSMSHRTDWADHRSWHARLIGLHGVDTITAANVVHRLLNKL